MQILTAKRSVLHTCRTSTSVVPCVPSACAPARPPACQANRNLSDPAEIEARIAEAQDANEFLRENVIQATKKDCGAYGRCSPGRCSPCGHWSAAQARPHIRTGTCPIRDLPYLTARTSHPSTA